DFLAHVRHQLLAQFLGAFLVANQGDVGVDALALDVVREAHHRRFGDLVVRYQRALHLGGADAVAGDIDHVVHAAGDPVVAVGVAAAAVAGEVGAGVGLEVGVDETIVVAVDRAHHPRPCVEDDQVALAFALDGHAVGVHQPGPDAEERERGRSRLPVERAGPRRDPAAAVPGPPPAVDDRAAAVADHFVRPAPGLRVDRLADAAQQPQRLARGLLHRLLALAHQRADRGRGGIEDGDLVLVHHLPEARVV